MAVGPIGENKERDLRARWSSLIAYLQRYHTDAQVSFFVTVRMPCRFTGGCMECLRLPPSLCSMCTARRETAWRQTRVRHTKAYQIVNKFSGDVGGDAAPPTFVCIRRICRLRRSLILLAKSIPYKFVRPLVERICHFFHTLKPLAEPVASWPGFAMYAHFYTGFSGNVIDFPTRRDKRASRAQNSRFPGTGSIPHNLFRAILR